MLIKIKSLYITLHDFVLFLLFSSFLIGSGQHNKKIIFIMMLYLCIYNTKKFVPFAKSMLQYWPFFSLIAWCFLSSTWSIWPNESRYISLTQVLLIFTCGLITFSYDKNSILLCLKFSAIFFIFVNTIYFLLFTGSSFASNGATGITEHKNSFGLLSAICILVFYSTRTLTIHELKNIELLFIFISIIFLLLSQSKSSIALVILSIILTSLLTKLKASSMKTISFFLKLYCPIIILLFGITTIYFQDAIIDFLYYSYDDNFLTGRGRIWMSLILNNMDSLTTGLGFGSVWDKGEYSEIFFTDIFITDPIWAEGLASSDGGYVDLLLSIGIFGGCMFAYYLLITLASILTTANSAHFRLCSTLFFFILFHNITETSFLLGSTSLWFLFVLVSCLSQSKNIYRGDHA